jgi:hypothetical protein
MVVLFKILLIALIIFEMMIIKSNLEVTVFFGLIIAKLISLISLIAYFK